MQYHHSALIPSSTHPLLQSLCKEIPLRNHLHSSLDEHGALRLRRDWHTHIGPLPTTAHGSRATPYNFTSVTIPECLPARLEVMAYAMEFMFLHDDRVDGGSEGEGTALFKGLMADVGGGALTVSGSGRILRGLIAEMRAIDAVRAGELLEWWKRGVSLPRGATFEGFEAYLEFRLVDAGAFMLSGFMTFGMGLTIPPEEKEECVRLTRCAWLAALLTNDVQSWEKEWEGEFKKQASAAHTDDSPHMVNGVWVLMKQDGVDVEEAICRVLEKVKGFVAEFVEVVREVQNRDDLSEDSRCFVEAAQYMVSGNLVWGSSSPRYHLDRLQYEIV